MGMGRTCRKQYRECRQTSRVEIGDRDAERGGAEQDSGPGEVDLHGLYVKEAIRFADKSISEARSRGDVQIRFIVGACCICMSAFLSHILTAVCAIGKGLHSANHVAKIKPAIEELMQKLVPPPPD